MTDVQMRVHGNSQQQERQTEVSYIGNILSSKHLYTCNDRRSELPRTSWPSCTDCNGPSIGNGFIISILFVPFRSLVHGYTLIMD